MQQRPIVATGPRASSVVAAPPKHPGRPTAFHSPAISPDADRDAQGAPRLVIIQRRRPAAHDDHVIIAAENPRRTRAGAPGRIRLAGLPDRRRIDLFDW